MNTFKIFNAILPSDISKVCPLTKDIILFFQNNYGALDENSLFEIKVILNELLLNAIKHGNRENKSKTVKVTAGICLDGLSYIIIEDEGEGYNYKLLLENSRDIGNIINSCDMKETGRGVLIVNNLCDKVKYSEKGNKVVVLKKLCKVPS